MSLSLPIPAHHVVIDDDDDDDGTIDPVVSPPASQPLLASNSLANSAEKHESAISTNPCQQPLALSPSRRLKSRVSSLFVNHSSHDAVIRGTFHFCFGYIQSLSVRLCSAILKSLLGSEVNSLRRLCIEH